LLTLIVIISLQLKLSTKLKGDSLYLKLEVLGQFYLQEVQPPPGFRSITTIMPISISASFVDSDRNHIVTAQVVNEVEGGFTLPETGGVGTILFTVFGLALIGGAVSLALIVRHRRSRSNQHD
jgi:LPXTG-motif cell wall-anchored protein